MTETQSDAEATELDQLAEPGAGGGSSRRGRGSRRAGDGRPSRLARLARFYREVVDQLRKVIWPSRNELVTYTSVVLVFVVIMVTVIGLLDYGFTRGVLAVFGK